mgnify:CR=1 FL=1
MMFEEGDIKRLTWILHNFPWTLGEENCAMLRRFRDAAREGK